MAIYYSIFPTLHSNTHTHTHIQTQQWPQKINRIFGRRRSSCRSSNSDGGSSCRRGKFGPVYIYDNC